MSAVRSSITTGGAGLAIRGKQTTARGDRCSVLMSSTPFAYPQVVSRTFASFRVQYFRRSARFLKGVRFPAAPLNMQVRVYFLADA